VTRARIAIAAAVLAAGAASCNKETPGTRAGGPAAQPVETAHAGGAQATPPATGSAAPAPTPAPTPPPAPEKEHNVTDVKLDWKLALAPDGKHLRIDYKVTNGTKGPIYVVDKMVVPAPGNKWARTDKIIVMNGDPGVVRFALAEVSSDMPSATLHTPTFKRVDGGATLESSRICPWPLVAWHPVGGASSIAAGATSGVLLVDYFPGEPPTWRTLASAEATPLEVPEGFASQTLRAGPTPLPAR